MLLYVILRKAPYLANNSSNTKEQRYQSVRRQAARQTLQRIQWTTVSPSRQIVLPIGEERLPHPVLVFAHVPARYGQSRAPFRGQGVDRERGVQARDAHPREVLERHLEAVQGSTRHPLKVALMETRVALEHAVDSPLEREEHQDDAVGRAPVTVQQVARDSEAAGAHGGELADLLGVPGFVPRHARKGERAGRVARWLVGGAAREPETQDDIVGLR